MTYAVVWQECSLIIFDVLQFPANNIPDIEMKIFLNLRKRFTYSKHLKFPKNTIKFSSNSSFAIPYIFGQFNRPDMQ